jgi:hypothetical protein
MSYTVEVFDWHKPRLCKYVDEKTGERYNQRLCHKNHSGFCKHHRPR